MIKLLIPVTLCIIIACNSSSCPESRLEGKEAIAAILARDTAVPGTFVVVPDAHLESSTRDVEKVLDQLVSIQLLSYQLKDSLRSKRTLNGTDETTFYLYDLQWSPSLERWAIKQAGTENVVTLDFLGKQYPGELRFTSRKFIAGTLRIPESDPLSFKEDCKGVAYRYTLMIDSTHALARIAGLGDLIKLNRTITTTVSYN